MSPFVQRPAVTLLEAIIALVILTAVASACLQLRAQAIGSAARLAARSSAQEGAREVLELAAAGLLPPDQMERDEETAGSGSAPGGASGGGGVIWRGERLGEPYQCTRTRQQVPNPARAALPAAKAQLLAAYVSVDRYEVHYAGATAQLVVPIFRR